MGKNNNLNIVEQERRAKKAKEIKRAKELRNKEKLERLSQLDPKRLQRRIHDLETKREKNNGRLLINEQRQLESLKKDLDYLNKKNLVKEEPIQEVNSDKDEPKPIELGSKSIFWDPEWNPLGIAPKGFKNITYPLKQQSQQSFDPEVEDIPIPNSPPPRFFKIQEAQVTYESAPEIKANNGSGGGGVNAMKFVPSVIRNRQNVGVKEKEQDAGDNKDEDDNDDDDYDDGMAEYASEEEEALHLKRKADELE